MSQTSGSIEILGTLVSIRGGDPIPLAQPVITIGRRTGCDIILDAPTISSKHCELRLIDGFWKIIDLNSRNGIKVNGIRYDTKWLSPEDEVSIAKIPFRIDYHPPEGKSPPPDMDENPFSKGLLEKLGLDQSARRKAAEKPPQLPPAAKKPSSQSFNPEEDDAMRWIMGEN